jgi:superfamily II DNA or RNA helicase
MDVIIMAGGGKSNKQTVQRVGRALRKSEGKSKAMIIDFYDADNGMLERHSKARLKTYKKESEFEINPIIEVD